MFGGPVKTGYIRILAAAKMISPSISLSGEHQAVAQLVAKRVLISPLINKDFPVGHPLLTRGNFASVNLNHQKRQ